MLEKATASAQQSAGWEGTSASMHFWGDTGQWGGEFWQSIRLTPEEAEMATNSFRLENWS